MKTDGAFEPIAVLLIDVPDIEDGVNPSWEELPGLPISGYRRARIYLRYKGTPIAKLNVDLDERGLPLEPIPDLQRAIGQLTRDAAPADPSTLPLVSIVVPTAGRRPELLKRCINSLMSIDYPRFEIVVVDNRGPSHTDDIESIWADSRDDASDDEHTIRVVRELRRGASFARNAGILAARAEIIAFTDDDVEVYENWLTGFVEAFTRSDEIKCVTGLVIPAELETEAQELCELYYGGFDRGLVPMTWSIPERKIGNRGPLRRSSFRVVETGLEEEPETKSIYVVAGNCGVGANFAVRRDFALTVPFDVALGVGSLARSAEETRFYADVLFAGYAMAYVPTSIVRHTHRRTMDELMIQMRSVGVGVTAYLVSLIFEDSRHVVGITLNGAPSALLRWVRSVFSGQSAAPGADEEQSFPPSFRRTELIGIMQGPWLYLRSRRHARSAENTK